MIIKNIKKKLPSAGIDGGGHEVVGSLKFIEGMYEEVISGLIKILSKVEVESSSSEIKE